MTPEEAVDLYVAAWNVDNAERHELLRRAFTEDAVLVGGQRAPAL